MDFVNLFSEEEREKFVRPYGDNQTITYQGLIHAAIKKSGVNLVDLDIAIAPTQDKSGMYYCVCRSTISDATKRTFTELGAARKADPVSAIEEASFLAKVNALRNYLNTDLECFEVIAKKNPPSPVTPIPQTVQPKAEPVQPQPQSQPQSQPQEEEPQEDKQVWNKKDVTELAALRNLMGLQKKDLIPFIKEWSRGLSNDLKAISQENIKAFNRFMRRKALEKFSEEEINNAVEAAWREAGCLE